MPVGSCCCSFLFCSLYTWLARTALKLPLPLPESIPPHPPPPPLTTPPLPPRAPTPTTIRTRAWGLCYGTSRSLSPARSPPPRCDRIESKTKRLCKGSGFVSSPSNCGRGGFKRGVRLRDRTYLLRAAHTTVLSWRTRRAMEGRQWRGGGGHRRVNYLTIKYERSRGMKIVALFMPSLQTIVIN